MLVQRRELLDELKRTNQELQDANAQLSRADQLKTAFINVASHELRTPLTILGGYTQLAASMPATPEPLRGWIDHIKQSSKRLGALINQIIAMLEQGNFQSQLQRQELDLGKLVSSVADEIQPFVELRKQSLSRDWKPGLGKITADGERLRDSLHQLLLNAIKFTADGRSIIFEARRTEDDGVEFVVGDSGCGMDEACLQQYGKAFFTQFDVKQHASGTHEHERRGLGLGVSLVRKFAEMHGGRLTVASTPGAGTSVTLFIPQSPPPTTIEGANDPGPA
jgi:signal transduction histidine kinase